MPVPIVCPHCTFVFETPARRPDGAILCGICGKAFVPTPAEVAALVAEAERLEALAAAEAAKYIPVAEVVPTTEAVPAEPAWSKLEPERSRAGGRFKRGATDRAIAEGDNPWAAFGRGSRLVCHGIATELVAVTVLMVILIFFGLQAPSGSSRGTSETPFGTVFLVLSGLSLLAVVIGSAVVAAGRTEQANVPEDRLSRATLGTVAFVGWMGVVAAVLAALIFAVGHESWQSGRDRGDIVGQLAFFGILAAFGCRISADLGALINLGLVSGAMPNRALRENVASINVVSQVFNLCYLGFVGLVSTGVLAPPTNRGMNVTFVLLMAVVFYVVGLMYGILTYNVNATAQRAAETWVPDQYE